MFVCKRIKDKPDTYIQFPNTAYKPTTYINGTAINFRELMNDASSNFEELCMINEKFASNKPVETSGYYKWVMMVPKGTYTIKGTTEFSEDSQLFDSSKKISEAKEHSVKIEKNTQIYLATIIEFIEAELNAKKITVEWDRVDTNVKVDKYANKHGLLKKLFDANHNEIKTVRGYYDLDPGDSSATTNGTKSVSVTLDKYDQLQKNQPIRLYGFEYYIRELKGFKYQYYGPYKANYGEDSGREANADKASCNIYIEVENLVDELKNSNLAKDFAPHTGEVNMNYNINMWFEKGDFWSNFTNLFNLKNSYLDYDICIQKNSNGTWQNLKELHGIKDSVTNSDNEKIVSEKFDDDGYYNINYKIDKEDISATLSDVDYNDGLRIKIHVTFKSKSSHANFRVNSPKLNITYGHKDMINTID